MFFLRVASAVAALRATGAHRVASVGGPLYLEWKCDLGHTNCTNSSKMEEWVRKVCNFTAERLEFESIRYSVRIPNKIQRSNDYKMYIYQFKDKTNIMSAADLIKAARDETVRQFYEKRRDLTLLVGQNLTRNVYMRHHKENYEGDTWAHWVLSLYIQYGTPFYVWAKCDVIQKHYVEKTFHWITKEVVTMTPMGFSKNDNIIIPVQLEKGTYVYGWQCFWAKTDDPFAGEDSLVTKLGDVRPSMKKKGSRSENVQSFRVEVGTMRNTDTYGFYKMIGTTKFGGFAEWRNYPAE